VSLYSAFKTDKTQERQGRWFDIAGVVNPDGTKPGFKMARMSSGNPAYQAAIEAAAKDMRQALDLDLLTEETASPVMRRVFVDTVLVDWRNVYDEAGNSLPYSKEAAEKLFEELPDLYLTLAEEARKLANFRTKEVEAVAKKSPQSSSKLSG
jgi:hypothetical protein